MQISRKAFWLSIFAFFLATFALGGAGARSADSAPGADLERGRHIATALTAMPIYAAPFDSAFDPTAVHCE